MPASTRPRLYRQLAEFALALLLLVPASQAFATSTAIPNRMALTQAPVLGSPPQRLFSSADGLPSAAIGSVSVDGRGYLWATFSQGVARYDGRRWTELPMTGRDGGAFVTTIVGTRDGTMYLLVDGVVMRLRDGEWQSLGPLPPIARIELDADQRVLWAVGADAVYALEGTRWRRYDQRNSVLPAGDFGALVPTRQGMLVHSLSGFYEFRAGRWQASAPPPPGVALTAARFGTVGFLPLVAVTYDRGGAQTVWFADATAVLGWRDGRWTRYEFGPTLAAGDRWYSIASDVDPEGNPRLWLGSDEGNLLLFEPGHARWRKYDSHNSALPVHRIGSMLVRAGQLWLALPGAGLASWRLDGWDHLNSDNAPLPSDVVNSFDETPAGSEAAIYLSTEDGLASWDGARWQVLDSSLLPSATTWGARVTGEGAERSLWVATTAGLARRRQGRWTYFTEANSGLPHNLVARMLETRALGEPTLVLGTNYSGLARVDGDTIRPIEDNLPSQRANVWGLQETVDAKGELSLWAGALRGGLRRLRGDRLDSYTHANSPLPSDDVFVLHATGDGRWLWLGTRNNVFRIDPGGDRPEWTPLKQLAPGLDHFEYVAAIESDRAGRIYIASTRGLYRLTPAGARYRVEHFTTLDGMPSNDCSNQAMLIDRKDRLWVATDRGIGLLDLHRPSPVRLPQPLQLERMRVNGTRALFDGDRLEYSQNNLEFDATLLSFTNEAQTRYQTQLVGFDPQPSAWVPEHRRTYTNLPAGDYRYVVRARDGYGVVSATPAVHFHIGRAPWLRWWAWLGYAIVLVVLGHQLVRWRLAAARRRNLELEALVDVRTAELAEARDAAVNLSVTDTLTGIANRRKFVDAVEEEIRRAARYGTPFSVVMLDVDHFKSVNDRFGHDVGDEVLKHVAKCLQQQVRATDLAARWGGEEFMLLLRETALANALALAEAVRASLEASPIPPADRVTASFGVAQYRAGEAFMALTTRVDGNLYEAKRSGRNRVVGDGPHD